MSELYDFASMPQLTTERMTLREARPDNDLPALYELFADPEVAHFTNRSLHDHGGGG